MYVSQLSLTHYRNFGRLELRLTEGSTLLFGANAQGKTNLLESLYYLATTRSPHTAQDDQLIDWDAAEISDQIVVGRIVAHLQTNQSQQLLELRLIRETINRQTSFRREALINRHKVRLLDLLGQLRVVLFVPQDLDLIIGAPADRRRYLDITLCQTDSDYCRTLSQYNKLLEQRNALLRQIAEQKRRGQEEMLAIFSEKLIQQAATIIFKRAHFLHNLAREVQRLHYEQLTDGKETLRLRYLPRLHPIALPFNEREQEIQSETVLTHSISEIAEKLQQHYTEHQATDIQRGTTTIGPHRDDWHAWINGRSVRTYGSRGQQRTTVLALKIGEIFWMTKTTGDTPILLLDDVMAELDPMRRALLLQILPSVQQAILTTADINLFPPPSSPMQPQ